MNPLSNEPERKKRTALLVMMQSIKDNDQRALNIGVAMFEVGERIERQLKNTANGLYGKH